MKGVKVAAGNLWGADDQGGRPGQSTCGANRPLREGRQYGKVQGSGGLGLYGSLVQPSGVTW
ncbi:hypothetical protein GCM10010270_59880 [Streptomyces violaceus]|nr:hypothetical protein GCM10010270_59880 [Streptomyces janthinus]